MSDDIDKTNVRIKQEGKQTLLHWNKHTLRTFSVHPNARDLRPTQVESLLVLLNSGNHWEAPIVVNLNTRTGDYTIIDGQHRFESANQFLAKHPNADISVPTIQYTDLTIEEMNEVFRKISGKGVKQNTSDRIKMEISELPIAAKILNHFPVKVTLSKSTPEGWSLPRLLRSYFERFKAPMDSMSNNQE